MATILVVDDLAANRDLLVTLLRYHGHRMLEAANGRDALALARGERPDLVITDVLMPVMDGYELVRQLRLDPATSGIPVVFYTARYGEREARDLALSSGVAHVLTKPVSPEDVLEVINSVLSGGSPPRTTAAPALTPAFDHEHLRLLTDKLSQTDEDLRTANARLRALINIGLELAAERNGERLLQSVCVSARELFAASYVTLGILDSADKTLRRLVASGVEPGAWAISGTPVPGALSAAVAERRTVRGNNPWGDPGALQFPPGHPEVHAYLIAPIASPAHVYGWICLVGNEGRTFSEEDEHMVTALSGQVGRIYENGHFYDLARAERDRAQRYLDTAEVILLALDLEGRITLINRKGCDLLGRREPELMGCNWIDTCLPSRARDDLRARLDCLIAGDLSIVESPILTQSGEERLIEWRNTLLRDAAGNTTGTLSSGTDITEHKRAELALKAAEERMRFALESADVGIWDMDYATGALEWSPMIEAQYGLQPGAFGGTFDHFISRVHPDDRAAMLETLEAASKSGADFSVENRAVWADGSVRWLRGAGRILLDAQGTPVRGIGISLDVTERRILEQQFGQAQKMEAIGRLAGGIAHDFNNLLTAILGYCELLLVGRDTASGDYGDIAEIKKAGERAAGLTRQLLAFSRKQIIEPTVLDLNALVNGMKPMLERLIGEDVTIVLNLHTGLARIVADHGQVEQVIMNLAVNARDAMPRGGTLAIETANVELDEHYAKTHLTAEPGAYVALIVTDTGTGMSPEILKRLFEPFFTTKELGKGTGLGLASVHGVVTRSGGTIGVYSEVGRGTSFKVYFPRSEATEPAVESTLQAPVRLGGTETVLVVEDADGLRDLAKRLLERQGYTVLLASSADQALQMFEANASIDVLLTDVVMPGASGPELTQRLLERRRSLKVVFMSGYTEDTITQHGVLKPGITFIQKPFTADVLGRKIREALDR